MTLLPQGYPIYADEDVSARSLTPKKKKKKMEHTHNNTVIIIINDLESCIVAVVVVHMHFLYFYI